MNGDYSKDSTDFKDSNNEILAALELLKGPIENYERGLEEFSQEIKNYENKMVNINLNHKFIKPKI